MIFDKNKEHLIYSTPSATTFLRVYAPVNIGFVALNGWFAIDEYLHPLVEGLNGYMWLCAGLSATGVMLGGTVEYFARRFVSEVHLLEDGKRIRLTFHTAYTFRKNSKIIPISCLKGGEEMSQHNYKIKIEGTGTVYFNDFRNELKDDPTARETFRKVIEGYWVNTIGP